MYDIIKTAHHWIAFVAIILLAMATVNGIIGSTSEKAFEDSHRKVNLFALIFTHIQLLLGLYLVFTSMAGADMKAIMGEAASRKAFVEHPTTNILAAVLVTIGNAKSKSAVGNGRKFKQTMIFFGLGLLLILSRLPYDKLF
jgi:spore maturation protein SpmA